MCGNCEAIWVNHTHTDHLCWQQLFVCNSHDLSTPIASSATTKHAISQRRAQLKWLITKSELNPDGMLGGKLVYASACEHWFGYLVNSLTIWSTFNNMSVIGRVNLLRWQGSSRQESEVLLNIGPNGLVVIFSYLKVCRQYMFYPFDGEGIYRSPLYVEKGHTIRCSLFPLADCVGSIAICTLWERTCARSFPARNTW